MQKEMTKSGREQLLLELGGQLDLDVTGRTSSFTVHHEADTFVAHLTDKELLDLWRLVNEACQIRVKVLKQRSEERQRLEEQYGNRFLTPDPRPAVSNGSHKRRSSPRSPAAKKSPPEPGSDREQAGPAVPAAKKPARRRNQSGTKKQSGRDRVTVKHVHTQPMVEMDPLIEHLKDWHGVLDIAPYQSAGYDTMLRLHEMMPHRKP